MRYLFVKLFTLSFLALSQSAYAIVELPKTGQTDSQIKTDDGELQLGKTWPSPRFTDNKDGTLTDHLSGLMWIKDAFCATNVISGGATLNWQESFSLAEAINKQTLKYSCQEYTADYQDWRPPNINELASLIRAGLSNNTNINDWLFLPNDQSGAFSDIGIVASSLWTSTSSAEDPENQAWVISLVTGKLSIKEKLTGTQLAFIFSPVRSIADPFYLASGQSMSFSENDDGNLQRGTPLPTPRFVITDAGTVIDKLTGLMWLQDANCANLNGSDWRSANNTFRSSIIFDDITTPFFENCPEYTPIITDGFAEIWRLPNINELRSLIDYGESNPALAINHPFKISTDKPFWSSTSANNIAEVSAWSLSFNTGELHPASDKNEFLYTWPVRGPVDFSDISVDKDTIQYNSSFINSEEVDRTIQIRNTGSAKLSIDLLQIINENNQLINGNFTIGQDGCSERNLDVGGKCSVVISFVPKRAGNLRAGLKIGSDALGVEEVIIPLIGKGLTATSTEKSNTSCFIATAVYGSFLEPEVQVLRAFRDSILLQHDWGTTFVAWYYKASPPFAEYLKNHETIRQIIRGVLTPIVYGIKYSGLFFCFLLFFSVYWLIKRLRIYNSHEY